MTSQYFLSLLRNGDNLSTITERSEDNLSMTSEDRRFLEVLDGPRGVHLHKIEGVVENEVYFSQFNLENGSEPRGMLPRPTPQIVRMFSNESRDGSLTHFFEDSNEGRSGTGDNGSDESDYEDIDGDPIYINVPRRATLKGKYNEPSLTFEAIRMQDHSEEVEPISPIFFDDEPRPETGTNNEAVEEETGEGFEPMETSIDTAESDEEEEGESVAARVILVLNDRVLNEMPLESLQELKRRIDACLEIRERGSASVSNV